MIDEEIDNIYDSLEDLFREDRFEEADKILADIDLGSDDDTLFSYLTASLSAKTKLPSRERLYDELVRREYSEDGDLRGLK